MTPTDARFRDEDVGPGRLGGFAEVGIKLLHARVVELIEEQEEVVVAVALSFAAAVVSGAFVEALSALDVVGLRG